MPGTLIRPRPALEGYPALRDQVRQTLLLGQERIEQEKVKTYWETGQLIHSHLLHHRDRADYGTKVIEKLAADLEIGERLLQRCLRFHREFPEIPSTWTELTWSHYRTLSSVPDQGSRFALANRAVRQAWDARKLELAVKQINTSRSFKSQSRNRHKAIELLTPLKGEFYTYRLLRPEKIHPGKTELRIDLGFSCHKEAAMKGAANSKAGDIAVSEWVEGDTYRLNKVAGKTDANLFTYHAYIEKVVDADTLLVQVDLGFGLWTRQYLRLRGVDAPEIDSADGKRAKKFVESELAGVPYVTIRTTRSDKYDRYLTDVFLPPASWRAPKERSNLESFLNNRLLESRLAWRV